MHAHTHTHTIVYPACNKIIDNLISKKSDLTNIALQSVLILLQDSESKRNYCVIVGCYIMAIVT